MTDTLRVAPAASASTAVAAGPATRAFLAVAALGAGLLHAALAPSAPPALLAAFLILALAELGWAAATLARDRPPVFRLIPALALVPVGLWAALAVVGATASGGTVLALPLAPMGAASLLDVTIAATAAVVIRRGRPNPDQSGSMRFVIALALSASVVCAVTIPALGLTDAGIAAVTVHHHH
ncbi:hypothetical protein [Leifsonia sp. fls2-241-R2A-40a]|uniref:hypothetical protein n=1 Tax=Leifsonia sp. fls2-241-R2A-40a TaxID=3040290 RepID=UPI00254CF2B2|nr:hypothetical protein [Leifsonia sp. fls2-241-R2A-40a]